MRPGNERALETWEDVRTVEKEISWPGGAGTAGRRSKEVWSEPGRDLRRKSSEIINMHIKPNLKFHTMVV